jgi:hypothetical protein
MILIIVKCFLDPELSGSVLRKIWGGGGAVFVGKEKPSPCTHCSVSSRNDHKSISRDEGYFSFSVFAEAIRTYLDFC